jgi:predicted amidophosphoribosyltransferase
MFGGHVSAARPLGRLLAERTRLDGLRADVVVDVPADPARERRRGFNQAAAIAAALAAELGIPHARRALRRTRPHRSQTELGLLDRAAAVAGAFGPGRGARAALSGKRVILVDDVLTTGATISACADACRQAGARTVAGACVARRIGRLRLAVSTPATSPAAGGP